MHHICYFMVSFELLANKKLDGPSHLFYHNFDFQKKIIYLHGATEKA